MLRMLFPGLYDSATSRDPADSWWYSDYPTDRTPAGASVTEDRALKYSAVWAASRVLCETSARVPMFLYERTGERSKRVAIEHPIYRLIHEQPNPDMTYSGFWEAMTQQQVNGGNCYAEIQRGRDGYPVALWPVHHTRVRLERVLVGSRERIVYMVRNDDGTTTPISSDDMLHVPGALSPDGISGRSIVFYGRNVIGTGLATEEFASRFFSNNARPGVVIKHPTELSPDAQQRLRESWKELYGGASKANGVAVLDEGMDLKEIGFSAEAAQFIESREFSLTEVARLYTMPPHKLGDLRRATFSNIEHQSLEFIDAVIPWNEKREQALTAKLLMPSERGRLFVECNFNGLLRGDSDARSKLYRELFGIGVYSINTILALENLNPIGPEGDRRFINSTMIPLDMAGVNHEKPAEPEPEPQETPDQEDDMESRALAEAAHEAELKAQRLAEANARARIFAERLLVNTMERMVSIEANEARRAAKKQANFVAWVDQFYTEHAERMQSALAPVVDVLGCVGPEVDLRSRIARHCADGRERLMGGAECQAEELPESIERLVDQWPQTRTRILQEATT